MLVDFTNRRENKESLPEIPYCRASEILVKDGRDYAHFSSLFALAAESSSVITHAINSGVSEAHPLEILKQLL